MSRGAASHDHIFHSGQNFLAILVESAAIYASVIVLQELLSPLTFYRSWAIFYAVTHETNSNVQFIAFDMGPPVVGIANALIQVRVGLGGTIEQTRASSSVTAPIQFVAHSGGDISGQSRV
ncbi:hypothetical protein B0H10DRAFT_273586 [Mycena sp. CBHHK59/15]|nr:hypothetical protein B0H10DRAFT_273586 [Mycena sp. CBHHK59/15]